MSSSAVSFLISLATTLPIYLIWLVGIAIALVRWSRHPGVSATLTSGLCALLLVSLGQRIVAFLLIENMQRSGGSAMTLGFYFSVLGIVSMLIRTTATAAVLVAVFGWREANQPSLEGTAAEKSPLQFSILGLMIVTLVVAILCAAIRALIGILGESAVFLLQLIDDLPLFICLLVGLVLAIKRRTRHPQVSVFAAIGIGLILAASLFWQLAWIWLSIGSSRYEWVNVLSAATTLVVSLGWPLVLIAVLGWRTQRESLPVTIKPG